MGSIKEDDVMVRGLIELLFFFKGSGGVSYVVSDLWR